MRPFQFVLLERARETATESNNFELARETVDELALRFEGDRIQWHATLLDDFAKGLPIKDKETVAVLKRAVGDLLDESVAEIRYDQAEKLLVTCKTALKRFRDEDFAKLAASYREPIQTGKSYYDALRRAQLVLDEKSDDPTANLTLGRFFCVVRDEWSRGASYLRHAENELLRQAAESELSVPAAADGQFEVAQAWSKVAGIADRRVGFADAARSRSRHWLMQAWGQCGRRLERENNRRIKKAPSVGRELGRHVVCSGTGRRVRDGVAAQRRGARPEVQVLQDRDRRRQAENV